jgi:hypothetical protein
MIRMVRAEVDATTENPDGTYGSTTGSYSYQTIHGLLAWASDLELLGVFLPAPLRVGCALSFVQRDVADQSSLGAGVNAGGSMRVAKSCELYAAGRNAGTLRGASLPSSSSLGAVMRFAGMCLDGDRLSVAAEASFSGESGAGGAVAAEYALGWAEVETALRAGYSLSGGGTPAGSLPTAGLAVRISSISLEVGVASLGKLGVAQVISLSYQDWRPPEERR